VCYRHVNAMLCYCCQQVSFSEPDLHFKLRVERRKFDALTRDLVARCRITVETALRGANLSPHDINEVIQ
jgi:molecular chaperone DnaK (HSP70)